MKTRSQAMQEASVGLHSEKKEKANEISKELAKELSTPPAPKFEFERAQRAGKAHELRQDLEQIVETVFVNDMAKMWQRLREGLTIGVKRSDHGTLMKALDLAEKRAHDAHRLYVTAKIERERWERQNEKVFGAMWSKATEVLQQEKTEGFRNKAITDADVRSKVATMFMDEYEAQEVRRLKIKSTVDSIEDLAEQWKSRCRTLQAMLNKMR